MCTEESKTKYTLHIAPRTANLVDFVAVHGHHSLPRKNRELEAALALELQWRELILVLCSSGRTKGQKTMAECQEGNRTTDKPDICKRKGECEIETFSRPAFQRTSSKISSLTSFASGPPAFSETSPTCVWPNCMGDTEVSERRNGGKTKHLLINTNLDGSE